jgi:MOSC domain-containing protein YiiM
VSGAARTVDSTTARCRLVGVQLGRAQPLDVGGRAVLSGICKRAVLGRVGVGPLGLDGDEQADLSVHGGLAKAVYAYPVEHYPFWNQCRQSWGLPASLPHGSLGENLTLTGLLETDVYVGDQLVFPDCVLSVTQPREPCFKFNAVMGSRDAARSMARSGFCGFYVSVDAGGTLAAGEAFVLRPGPRAMPLMRLFRAGRRGST